jgi:hypothetical protein
MDELLAHPSAQVTIDPVTAVHRPLLWYSVCARAALEEHGCSLANQIVFIVDHITAFHLYQSGFKHCAPKDRLTVFPPRPWTMLSRQKPLHPQLSYWYRPHLSKTKHPVVFLHGVGVRTPPSRVPPIG